MPWSTTKMHPQPNKHRKLFRLLFQVPFETPSDQLQHSFSRSLRAAAEELGLSSGNFGARVSSRSTALETTGEQNLWMPMWQQAPRAQNALAD